MRLESLSAATMVDLSSFSVHFAQRQSFRGGHGGRGHSSTGGKGHFPYGGRGYNSFNKPLCQICGRMGHIALKCFYRFDVRYQNQFQNQKPLGEYSADESSIPVSQSQAYITSPMTVNDASWFLDSGATHHVTSITNSMNTNSEYSGTGKLTLGDGSKLPITHIGHITLPTSHSLHLKNVLMVPSITKNLINISKFTIKNDVIVEFDSTCGYIKDKQSWKILLQGVLKDGLYQLHLSPPLSTPLSSSSSYNKDHYNVSTVHLDASSLHSVLN